MYLIRHRILPPVFTGLIVLLGLNVSCASGQTNPQPLFDKANNYLESGDYRIALSMYRELERNEQLSGSLFLNMAISYVELDSLGLAKYYFMKAGQFDETRKNAVQGLDYVNSRFSRQSAVLPKLPWQRLLDWVSEAIGASLLLGLGIILLNMGVIGFVARWFITVPGEKYFKFGGIGVAVIGIIFVLTSFYIHYRDNRYHPAVMIHNQTNVREQPDSTSAVVSQAFEGYTFTVDRYKSEEYPAWYYVRMSNGLYGWIPGNDIRIL